MIRFASGFRGLLTARPPPLGRQRVAGIVVASWFTLLAGSGLPTCCDILSAAPPHDHRLHSGAADHDANPAAGGEAPRLPCTTIRDIDRVVANAAPLSVAQLQLPEVSWLPAAAVVRAPMRQLAAFLTGYPRPPPLPGFYLRTLRLLI